MGDSDQLIVLKINQINGINDEIVIGANDDSAVLAARFAEVNKMTCLFAYTINKSLLTVYYMFIICPIETSVR